MICDFTEPKDSQNNSLVLLSKNCLPLEVALSILAPMIFCDGRNKIQDDFSRVFDWMDSFACSSSADGWNQGHCVPVLEWKNLSARHIFFVQG